MKKNLFFDTLDIIGCQKLMLSGVYNKDTLNIFSDASIVKRNNVTYGCYGIICVVEEEIIDFKYIPKANTTVNECEIYGILLALQFANTYKSKFKFINIFSDSLISVKGLTEYIYGWRYQNYNLYNSANKVVANQSIFVEAYDILQKILLVNPNIKIYHLSGHINTNNPSCIANAAQKFKEFNRYYGQIDLNFIRYISSFNNFIDNATREYLKRYNSKSYPTNPIKFFPTHPY